MTQIPAESRAALAMRDLACLVCGSGRDLHWHHRRSRRVRDEHTHCPCNGVSACAQDHERIHRSPAWARSRGLIVSSYRDQPGEVPVYTYSGWALLTCNATMLLIPPPKETAQ